MPTANPRRWRKRWAIPGALAAGLALVLAWGDLRLRMLKAPPDGPLIAVECGGKFGFVAANGAVAVPFVWDDATPIIWDASGRLFWGEPQLFSNGTARVVRDGEWRRIYRDGQLVDPSLGPNDPVGTQQGLRASKNSYRRFIISPEMRPAETLLCGGSAAAAKELMWNLYRDQYPSDCVGGGHRIGEFVPGGTAMPTFDLVAGLRRDGDHYVASMPLHPWLEYPTTGKLLSWTGLSKWPGFTDVQAIFDLEGRTVWRSDFHLGQAFLLPAAAMFGFFAASCLLLARRGEPRPRPQP